MDRSTPKGGSAPPVPPYRFEDHGEIGRGGMSVVRKAWDPLLERHTAIKVLAPSGDNARARQRFLDEARITGQLEHPNIVPIYAFGTDPQGRDFINMKLVQGQNFLDRLREQGDHRLDPDHLHESLQILLKVLDAVDFAHSRGVVHRDLKPSNIMTGEFGEVYVMDWGIAFRKGQPVASDAEAGIDERNIIGTPTFVAPEQIDDPDASDERADVYCLGGILYALLTGRAPHQGRTPMLRLLASSQGRIPPPEEVATDPRLPAALSRVAMKALRRDPRDRYPSVAAFKADLRAFMTGSWHLPRRRVAAGEAVVSEGMPGDEAYVIKTGRCAVRSKAQGVIRTLGPGDVFGEVAILSRGGLRTSTVVAETEVELLVVTRQVLAEGLGLNSWMGVFVKALADRFADLEQRLGAR